MSTLLIVVVVLLLIGGFGVYGGGPNYPYRGYAFPGIGGLLVLLVVLYLLGVFR